jgi:hypothetical protein
VELRYFGGLNVQDTGRRDQGVGGDRYARLESGAGWLPVQIRGRGWFRRVGPGARFCQVKARFLRDSGTWGIYEDKLPFATHRAFYPVNTSSRRRSSAPCFTGIVRGAVDRVYCLGEQPITRRKALPNALSDS